MRNFFKIFFASCLSLIVFTIASVFILVWIISSAASSDKPNIASKSILVIDLSQHFAEQKQEDPFGFISAKSENDIPGLYDVVRMIGHASTDNNIKGIYIKCQNNANGNASSNQLRKALIDFKKSKKFVVAYGDYISQSAYYVASVADKLYCNPMGSVDWRGMSVNLMFLKGALEKLDIEPQIFYAGKFKSATEPLRAYEMSEANRLQTSVYLNDLYSQILLSAAEKSKSDTASLHELANTFAIQRGQDAAKYKLIDAVKYEDEVRTELLQMVGLDKNDKLKLVSLAKYAKASSFKQKGEEKIAIIYAEGEIIDGKGKERVIGADDYREIIEKARLDNDIKAIVLRVNSPGGSVLASEIIWRELTLAKKEKPVVVSFGDVAASGGYYISCNADSIFAETNSITGSIGVFGVIPNMKKFFNNKLGITFDGVKTGPFADFGSIDRPLNAQEGSMVQNIIDTIYSDFKMRVATGRKLSIARVDSLAQGRVWTGIRALDLGLVDKLGSLDDAVNCAVRMAKLKSFSVKEYPEVKSFIDKILEGETNENLKAKAIKAEIGEEQYFYLQQLKKVKHMVTSPQARLPFDLKFN